MHHMFKHPKSVFSLIQLFTVLFFSLLLFKVPDFFFFLILLLITQLILLLNHFIRKKRTGPEGITSLSITKKNLFRIAVWPHIRKWLLYCLPIVLILTVVSINGRMNALVLLASILAIAVYTIPFCLPQLKAQCQPLAHLHHIPDFDRLFEDKTLSWKNGAWNYADHEWFIRVSSRHSVALHADDIDFTAPIQTYSYNWNPPSKSGSLPLILNKLVFAGKNGNILVACSEADQNITNWILQHGGSLAGKKKKRK